MPAFVQARTPASSSSSNETRRSSQMLSNPRLVRGSLIRGREVSGGFQRAWRAHAEAEPLKVISIWLRFRVPLACLGASGPYEWRPCLAASRPFGQNLHGSTKPQPGSRGGDVFQAVSRRHHPPHPRPHVTAADTGTSPHLSTTVSRNTPAAKAERVSPVF